MCARPVELEEFAPNPPKLKRKSITRGVVDLLLRVQSLRDPYTAAHERRVADLARKIAEKMGFSETRLRNLELGALIHDIGKISIPVALLSKPGRLSEEEFALVKTHANAGFGIVKDTALPTIIGDIVLHHHERWDGSGYPGGLSGTDIPLECRIIAVADTLEAVTSHRPYRPALGLAAGLEILGHDHPSCYDPNVVAAVFALVAEDEDFWPDDGQLTSVVH